MNILIFVSAFLLSLIIALKIFPVFISYLKENKVLDRPDHRKHHVIPTPSGGGLVFILSAGFSSCIWGYFSGYEVPMLPMALLGVLLVTGLVDDFKGMDALAKLGIQIGVAALLIGGGYGISNLQGIFGLYEIPAWAQWALGIVLTVGFINAFNLIDGVDGLAGGLGTLILSALSINAYYAGDHGVALLGLSMVGGLLAFLRFNFHPAKIFMGDTGSLGLGFVIVFMVMRSFSYGMEGGFAEAGMLSPLMVLSLLMVPTVDTLQVFSTRIALGLSPLRADRRHTHHLMLRTHMNAPQVSVTLWIIAAVAFFLGGILSATWGLLVLVGLGLFGIGFIRVQLLVREDGKAFPALYQFATRVSLIVFALVSSAQLIG